MTFQEDITASGGPGPLAVDPGHPFPFISNLSISLGVELRTPDGGERLFARVKVPQVLPQWVRLETPEKQGEYRYISLLDVIRHNLNDLFPDMVVGDVMPFRITRNADVQGDFEDADDLMEQIQAQLRERRFAPVVRMEVPEGASAELLARGAVAVEAGGAGVGVVGYGGSAVVGGGGGRVFKIGNQPINARLEAYYNVERPENAPDWQMVFTFQMLFPK